jgi:hypothetical protein
MSMNNIRGLVRATPLRAWGCAVAVFLIACATASDSEDRLRPGLTGLSERRITSVTVYGPEESSEGVLVDRTHWGGLLKALHTIKLAAGIRSLSPSDPQPSGWVVAQVVQIAGTPTGGYRINIATNPSLPGHVYAFVFDNEEHTFNVYDGQKLWAWLKTVKSLSPLMRN